MLKLRVIAALVLIAGCCAAQVEVLFTQSPAFVPASMAELVKSSKLIVRGRFKGGSVARAYSGLPERDHVFTVAEVFQGDVRVGTDILVSQAGGEWEGKRFVTRELVEFANGVEAVMFLVADRDDGESRARLRRYRVNGLWAGAFLLKGEEVEVSKEVQGELREVGRMGRDGLLRRVRAETKGEK